MFYVLGLFVCLIQWIFENVRWRCSDSINTFLQIQFIVQITKWCWHFYPLWIERALVFWRYAVLFAAVLSRFSNEVLAVIQSDSMRRVQRDSSLVSWCRILILERSSEPRHRACPAQRRRFWRRSADIFGTSVSCRTRWSRDMCSSGDLATMRRKSRKWVFSRRVATVLPATIQHCSWNYENTSQY